MKSETRNSFIAAALILGGFALAAFYLPSLMLAAGEESLWLAGLVAILFIAAFFAIFWLRGRYRQGSKD